MGRSTRSARRLRSLLAMPRRRPRRARLRWPAAPRRSVVRSVASSASDLKRLTSHVYRRKQHSVLALRASRLGYVLHGLSLPPRPAECISCLTDDADPSEPPTDENQILPW